MTVRLADLHLFHRSGPISRSFRCFGSATDTTYYATGSIFTDARVRPRFRDGLRGCTIGALPNLRHAQHLGGIVAPARRRRQRFPILLVQLNHFIHRLAQLLEDRQLIIAVAAAMQQPRAPAHETPVFFRPLHNLYVASFPSLGSLRDCGNDDIA